MKKIILLYVFISTCVVANISLSVHDVTNTYVIKTKGVKSIIHVRGLVGYDLEDGKKEHGELTFFGSVDASITSKESYDTSLSYKCMVSIAHKYPESNNKEESISLYVSNNLIKKYGLDNENPYYFTFSNKYDSFTVLSGDRKEGGKVNFQFKWEVATKVRKLLQSDDELKVIVRNSSFPNLSFYFDGFQKGYDKINDCINAK